MSSLVGLLGVFVDVVLLLALATAVANPRASQLARLVIATFAFVCAWLIAAVFDSLRAPAWTIFVGGAVIVIIVVVMTATLHLWAQEGEGTSSGQRHRGDDGEGGPRHRRPQPGGGGSDPDWWPEFERQLASHVAERERVAPTAMIHRNRTSRRNIPVRPTGLLRPGPDRRRTPPGRR